MHPPISPKTEGYLKSHLLQVGFNNREIDIYVCLCSLGAQAGSVIARNTGMKRTTVYHTLHRLVDRGFITHYKKKSTSYFKICPLEDAMARLDRKKEQVEEQQVYLKQISALVDERVHINRNSMVDMRYLQYEGIDELKQLKLSLLQPGETICMYIYPEDNGQVFVAEKQFWNKYYHRVVTNNVTLKILIPRTLGGIHLRKNIHQAFVNNIRIMPSKSFPTPQGIEVNILKNRVVMIDNQSGVTIESQKVAQLQLSTFGLAWKNATEIS